jgi:cytidylate kinase
MNALTQHGLTSDEYFSLLVKTIGTIAWQGNAVIVGRGAAHIIPRAHCLTVRFVAPVDTRIEILSAERGIGSEEARDQIVHADLARREFLKHYFRTTPEHDLATFDLVINNQCLGLRASVEVLETALLAKTSADVRSALKAIVPDLHDD